MQDVHHGALDPDLLFPTTTSLSGAFDNAAAMPPAHHAHHHHGTIATFAIVRDAPILNSAEAVSRYLKPLMAGRPREVFYVLCLYIKRQ